MAVDYSTLKKGGFMRQKQKNCFSLRLAVVGGNLTAENLKTIAEVADKYGDGHVHFTSCQGNQICPSGNIDTYDIAKKLDERYFARELPHKFKFGVTGCQNNCLKAEENDVGIKGATKVQWKEDACISCGVCVKACRTGAITLEDNKIKVDESKCNYCGRCVKACPTDAWDAKSGYLVSFGGLFGNRIHKGEEILPVIESEEDLFRVTDAAIQFFDDNANPSERFRFTIERVGEDKFIEKMKEAYHG